MPLSPTSELLNTATHGQRKKYFIAGKILQISLKLDHGCGVQRLECTAAHQKVRLQLAGDVLQLGGDWFWLIVFELRNDTMADDLLWQMNMTPKYVFNGLMLKSSLERGGTVRGRLGGLSLDFTLGDGVRVPRVNRDLLLTYVI